MNLEQIAKPIAGLHDRIEELQKQNVELKGWRSRAQDLSIELEEEKRRRNTNMQDQQDRQEDQSGEKVYRKEIERESNVLDHWGRIRVLMTNE